MKNDKQEKRKVRTQASLDLIGRIRLYFLRGHNSWLYLPIWFVNIMIIIYKLFLEDLEFMPEWVSFWKFALFFTVLYLPIAVLIGRFDYYRGTYKGEAELGMHVNPIWKRQFNEMEILRNEVKELKALLIEKNKGD